MKLSRLLAALVAAASLAGCSDDDPEPKFEPSETVSSPTSTATTDPPEDLEPEAVVRAWVDAQNVALTTGETADLRRLSDASCSTCITSFVKPIEEVYAAGGRFVTDGWAVTAAKSRDRSKSPVVVDVGVDIAGGRTFADADADPVAYEAEKKILLFKVDGSAVTFVGFLS